MTPTHRGKALLPWGSLVRHGLGQRGRGAVNVRSLYRRRVPQGEVLIREGERGTELFVLEKGMLEVSIQGRKVGVVDASLSQEFVGEVAALLGEPRTATVRTLSECLVLAIPSVELDDVLLKSPTLGAKLARSLCRKLRCSSQAHLALKMGETSLALSGNVEASIRNYMKGLLYLMDQTQLDVSGEASRRLCDYFRKTNPWGIAQGEEKQILDV